MARILIAGCGDVGSALAQRLVARGHEVWGMRRQVERLPAAVRPLRGDLGVVGSYTPPPDLDFVVYSAAAGSRDDRAYREVYVRGLSGLIDTLRAQGQQPRRLVFTSSTAVFAQDDGSWVDENAPTAPTAFNGRRMLEAEALLHAAPWPTTAVRLGGIYGPGRTRLIRRAQGGEPCQRRPPRWTNRIHRDDCAGLLAHLLSLPDCPPCLIGVDEEPAPLYEVMTWLRQTLGLPPPPTLDEPQGGQGKRCRSQHLRAIGYSFVFPTFRQGYAALLP